MSVSSESIIIYMNILKFPFKEMDSNSNPEYLMSSTSEEVSEQVPENRISDPMPTATMSLNIQNNKYTTVNFAIYPIQNVLVFRHVAFRAMYEIVCVGQLCVTPLGLKDYCVELFTQNGTKAHVQDVFVSRKESGAADAVWVLATDGVDTSVFRFQLGCF